MKYIVEKHKNGNISLSTERIKLDFGSEPETLGEIDIPEQDLGKVEVKLKRKGFKIERLK